MVAHTEATVVDHLSGEHPVLRSIVIPQHRAAPGGRGRAVKPAGSGRRRQRQPATLGPRPRRSARAHPRVTPPVATAAVEGRGARRDRRPHGRVRCVPRHDQHHGQQHSADGVHGAGIGRVVGVVGEVVGAVDGGRARFYGYSPKTRGRLVGPSLTPSRNLACARQTPVRSSPSTILFTRSKPYCRP